MRKYQPRIHLVRLMPSQHQQQLCHRHPHLSDDIAEPLQTPKSMTSHPAVTLRDLELTSDCISTFVFAETVFTAVTAYQNQLVIIHHLIHSTLFGCYSRTILHEY